MFGFGILLTLLYSTNIALTCTDDKVYVKLIMTCGVSASDQSFVVRSESTNIYVSPLFENFATRTLEQCFSRTTDLQYTVDLLGKYSSSWSANSFLEIQGIYGNTVFKNYMNGKKIDTYPLSLYYAVTKGTTWKFIASSVSTSWTSSTFNDATWSDYTNGQASSTSSGPHYFRKAFKGLEDMAAIDLRVKYSTGIVAYINGEEMWRDNMPSGVVTSDVLANGAYGTADYRGVVRSGGSAQHTESILAVEIHFETIGNQAVDFDAFMAILAPSLHDSHCTPCFIDSTVTAEGFAPDRITNWNKNDHYYSATIGSGIPIDIVYSGLVSPLINGIAIYPYTFTSEAPRDFVFSVASSATVPATYHSLMTETGWTYTNSVPHIGWSLDPLPNASNRYRLFVTGVASAGSVRIPEAQMLICNVSPPVSIKYKEDNVVAYSRYSVLDIQTVKTGITNCTVIPSLPSGLSLSSVCSIVGVANEAKAATTYVITSSLFGGISGAVTLTVSECMGTMIEVKIVFDTRSSRQGFDIRDAATNDVILSQAPEGDQADNTIDVYNLCVLYPRIVVNTICTGSYWRADSMMYVSLYTYRDEKELLVRTRFDTYIGVKTSHIVDINYAIKSHEMWFYKFDTIPVNWFSASSDGFIQKMVGEFPAASNRIQLYKKIFTISSLANTAAFVIGLKYKYACVVYLNGHEVFRNQITGDLASNSIAEGSYTELMMRYMSLPIKAMTSKENPAVEYLKQGENIIAIALVSIAVTQTVTDFDCVLHLVSDNGSSRVNDYVATKTSMTGNTKVLDMYNGYFIQSTTCTDNDFQLIFDNDRREWISSLILQNDYNKNEKLISNFSFEARNAGDSTWTTLKTVEGLTWSMPNQKMKIWIQNNKSWNQYRWRNFSSGNPSSCAWKIQAMDLLCDNMAIVIPELAYESVKIYQGIEMTELYPNSALYTEFSVTPVLPAGIVINPFTGVISGTSSTLLAIKEYSVTARKIIGGESIAKFSLSVEVCHDGENLITFVLNVDNNAAENAYSLYHGRDISATPYKKVSPFPISSGLLYVDVCMPYNIYTFIATDLYGDGWRVGSGIKMTIDQGSLAVNMYTIAKCETKPCNVIIPFSTMMPFQILLEDWTVLTGIELAPTMWKDITFDDKNWTTTKAAAIGTNSAITTYIRRSFTIPSLTDYHVMNAHIKYTGGVVAYLNGNIVARFNMPDTFNANTESLTLHDASKYSAFHVILIMAGAVNGTNVMAFEVHRPVGGSSADAVVFDASAVFGVEDCSVVVDSFAEIVGSTPYAGKLEEMLDLDVTTSCTLNKINNEYISWVVENQEGSIFNTYGFSSSYSVGMWGFSLLGRFETGNKKLTGEADNEEEEYTTLSRIPSSSIVNREMNHWDTPVGVMGFRQFKWNYDDAPSYTTAIYSLYMRYCKATGAICPAMDEFTTVSEGQISPAACPKGYKGYLYRICEKGGKFSEIKRENCMNIPPKNLHYERSLYIFVKDTFVSSGIPTYDNIIDYFYVDDNVVLPAGLSLNEKTGEISGIPSVQMEITSFVVLGRNSADVVSFSMTISVRNGVCNPDGIWPKTEVDVMAIYDCTNQGSYVGSMTRGCVLGEKDGMWTSEEGICISLLVITISIIIVICIIVVVMAVVVRMILRRKAVGGVKGKKKAATKSPKIVNDKISKVNFVV